MIHDQHCHSSYSLDSNEPLESYFQICENYKIPYLITTEHIEYASLYNFKNWTVDYPNLKKDLAMLEKKYPSVHALLGVEIGYKKEYTKQIQQIIKSQDFDVVNLSIHDNGVYDYYIVDHFKKVGIKKMLNIYFDNIVYALSKFTDFDCLSHFDYGFKTAHFIDNNITINDYESVVRKIFKLLIAQDKALEINMKVQRSINDFEHLYTILKWYYEEGGRKLTLSSDSHNKDSYKKFFLEQNTYLSIIKNAGFKYLCFFKKRNEYHYNL